MNGRDHSTSDRHIINNKTYFQKLHSAQGNRRPISEYLLPESKTIIEYDCMPTFANILAASIIDMDENLIVKSFGIKKGIEPEILLPIELQQF